MSLVCTAICQPGYLPFYAATQDKELHIQCHNHPSREYTRSFIPLFLGVWKGTVLRYILGMACIIFLQKMEFSGWLLICYAGRFPPLARSFSSLWHLLWEVCETEERFAAGWRFLGKQRGASPGGPFADSESFTDHFWKLCKQVSLPVPWGMEVLLIYNLLFW